MKGNTNMKSYFDIILADAKAAFAIREMGGNRVFGYLGAPGVGKTAIMAQVAKEIGAELWDSLNLAASTPMDIQIKIPNIEDGTFTTLASDDFPWEDSVGDRKIIFFMDEKTNASADVNKATQQFLISRRIGSKVLGKNVVVMLAGNRQTDKAGSGNLSTAVYNRVTWRNLEWTANHSEHAVDHLISKYRPSPEAMTPTARDTLALIAGYFAHKPILEKDFTDALAKIGKDPYIQWCSPRSLEALIARIAVNNWELLPIEDMAGDIGLGRATELTGFASLLGKLPKYEEVLADPKGAKLPGEPDAKYAMCAMLAVRVNEDDFEKVWEYVSRISEVTMRVVFIKMSVKAHPELRGSVAIRNVIKGDRQLVAAVGAVGVA